MRRRSVILALAGVLVVGIVTPVLGHSRHAGVDRALDRAKKAKKIAKDARQTAQQALTLAQQAQQSQGGSPAIVSDTESSLVTSNARQTAQQALTLAQQAQQGQGGSPAIVSDTESALVTSNAPIGEFEDKGGPSVQVTVPSSGLIEVWAQADILDDEGGAVALYEDGQPVPGIADASFCGDPSVLFEMQGLGPGEFATFSTPPNANGILGCTNVGAPAPVLLQRPPGEHTYELRYSECSCGGSAEFQNRVLRVGPRL